MRQYGLSAQRVLRIIHSPKRVEEGVAPRTVAMMQPLFVVNAKSQIPNDKLRETWKQELWVMFQDAGSKRKIISAWRYPGMSKVRSEAVFNLFRMEFEEYLKAEEKEMERHTPTMMSKFKLAAKWHTPGREKPKFSWPKRPFRRKKQDSNTVTLD